MIKKTFRLFEHEEKVYHSASSENFTHVTFFIQTFDTSTLLFDSFYTNDANECFRERAFKSH